MSFLKKLFQPKEAPVNEMSYSAVWEEFMRIVPYRDGEMFITMLQKLEYETALKWLSPGTECPMAKALVRGLVDYFRTPNGEINDLVMVYQAESVEKWSTPPDESLAAAGQIAEITGLKVIVYYKPTPEEEHVKLEITPNVP